MVRAITRVSARLFFILSKLRRQVLVMMQEEVCWVWVACGCVLFECFAWHLHGGVLGNAPLQAGAHTTWMQGGWIARMVIRWRQPMMILYEAFV